LKHKLLKTIKYIDLDMCDVFTNILFHIHTWYIYSIFGQYPL